MVGVSIAYLASIALAFQASTCIIQAMHMNAKRQKSLVMKLVLLPLFLGFFVVKTNAVAAQTLPVPTAQSGPNSTLQAPQTSPLQAGTADPSSSLQPASSGDTYKEATQGLTVFDSTSSAAQQETSGLRVSELLLFVLIILVATGGVYLWGTRPRAKPTELPIEAEPAVEPTRQKSKQKSKKKKAKQLAK
jgi:hypothetical protein